MLYYLLDGKLDERVPLYLFYLYHKCAIPVYEDYMNA